MNPTSLQIREKRMEAAGKPMLGLVLSGGRSLRMGKDKGSLVYSPFGFSQRQRCVKLLAPFCDQVFVSCRPEQHGEIEPELLTILDSVSGEGPGVGILSAARQHPRRTWFVLACDFPWLSEEDLAHLVRERDKAKAATFYVHGDATIEPLFAIWEPPAIEALEYDFARGLDSPRRTLLRLDCQGVVPLDSTRLENVNAVQTGLFVHVSTGHPSRGR